MLGLFLAVAILGGVASVLRVIVIDFVQGQHSSTFPYGTLVVNALGCFIFGLVWALFEKRVDWHPEIKLVIMAGFAGAFTTYSTYAFETWQLIEKSQYVLAAANMLTQTVLGIGLVFVGVIFGRWLG